MCFSFSNHCIRRQSCIRTAEGRLCKRSGTKTRTTNSCHAVVLLAWRDAAGYHADTNAHEMDNLLKFSLVIVFLRIEESGGKISNSKCQVYTARTRREYVGTRESNKSPEPRVRLP